jgi:hypothetical protein
MKDPNKILVPGSDLILVALCKDEPEGYIPFPSLVHLPLHLGHGSTIDSIGKWITRHPHRRLGSRSQIPNRIQDGLSELVQLLPDQPPVKHLAHIPAIPPKVDVVLIVSQGVLEARQSAVRVREGVGGGTYPNHSQEGAGGTEGNLSGRNTTGILCDV